MATAEPVLAPSVEVEDTTALKAAVEEEAMNLEGDENEAVSDGEKEPEEAVKVVKKTGRGRPPKDPKDIITPNYSYVPGQPKGTPTTAVSGKAKGRGRPPKDPADIQTPNYNYVPVGETPNGVDSESEDPADGGVDEDGDGIPQKAHVKIVKQPAKGRGRPRGKGVERRGRPKGSMKKAAEDGGGDAGESEGGDVVKTPKAKGRKRKGEIEPSRKSSRATHIDYAKLLEYDSDEFMETVSDEESTRRKYEGVQPPYIGVKSGYDSDFSPSKYDKSTVEIDDGEGGKKIRHSERETETKKYDNEDSADSAGSGDSDNYDIYVSKTPQGKSKSHKKTKKAGRGRPRKSEVEKPSAKQSHHKKNYNSEEDDSDTESEEEPDSDTSFTPEDKYIPVKGKKKEEGKAKGRPKKPSAELVNKVKTMYTEVDSDEDMDEQSYVVPAKKVKGKNPQEKRGRPRKEPEAAAGQDDDEENDDEEDDDEDEDQEKEEENYVTPAKKVKKQDGRGRPKKNPATPVSSTPGSAEKKGRGRPKKSPASSTKSNGTQGSGKGRGRPKKAVAEDEQDTKWISDDVAAIKEASNAGSDQENEASDSDIEPPKAEETIAAE